MFQLTTNRILGWLLIAVGALIVFVAVPGHHHGWELTAVIIEFVGAFLLGTGLRKQLKK